MEVIGSNPSESVEGTRIKEDDEYDGVRIKLQAERSMVSTVSRRFVSITVLLLWLTPGCPAYAEEPLPQREFKAYVLHENPNSADISPDDSFVVTELSRREPTNDPSTGKCSDLVQLWVTVLKM